MKQETVLVTGGAGYIGSHAVKQLLSRGYSVVILDNLEYGHKDIIESAFDVPLLLGDIRDKDTVGRILDEYHVDAVMHFAAYIAVGESVEKPSEYYWNNFTGALNLLDCMRDAGVDKFIFSSTCATYGIPQFSPITEDHPQKPINPYAFSKFAVENVLKDFEIAYGIKSVIFRYFNASGADPEGNLGEDHDPETHLIPLILFQALGLRDSISIFGTDYPTPDGTCVRDYIHVTDLADAHVLGLEYLTRGGSSDVFNLGNGNGFSVRQVIQVAEKVTGKKIKVVEGPRRAGDSTELVGSSEKAKNILGWTPQYANLETIVSHAWNWHQKRHARQ